MGLSKSPDRQMPSEDDVYKKLQNEYETRVFAGRLIEER